MKADNFKRILFCSIIAVSMTDLFGGDFNDDWKAFIAQYRNPNDHIFERWAVIEKVPLVKKEGKVPAEFASAASVLAFLDSDGSRYEGRFSKGDELIYTKILESFGKRSQNNDFADGIYKLYTSYIADLNDRIEDDPNLSSGQLLAKTLYKTSANPKDAVSSYMSERLYMPLVRTKINTDIAKTLLDSRIPFTLQNGEKSFVCLGYFEKNGTVMFIVADNDQVDQIASARADMVIGKGELAQAIKQFNASLDKQFGPIIEDQKFVVSDVPAKGISFMAIEKETTGLIVCKPVPDAGKIKEFIKSNDKEITNIINFSESKSDDERTK